MVLSCSYEVSTMLWKWFIYDETTSKSVMAEYGVRLPIMTMLLLVGAF